jgi:hypothetical protein
MCEGYQLSNEPIVLNAEEVKVDGIAFSTSSSTDMAHEKRRRLASRDRQIASGEGKDYGSDVGAPPHLYRSGWLEPAGEVIWEMPVC